jgi:hypothetical protein
MRKKHKLLLLIVVPFVSMPVLAQPFKMHTLLDSVQLSGFYEVAITPELSAYAQPDLRDVRIKDNSGAYTSYLVRKAMSQASTKQQHSKQLTIVSNSRVGKFTILIVKRDKDAYNYPAKQIVLSLRNNAVQCTASLSGSNEPNNWYAIADKVTLYSSHDDSQPTYTQTIEMPPSEYAYFKIKIDNANKDPLAIIGASIIEAPLVDTPAPATYIQNPNPDIAQIDSGGYSYITITNRLPYRMSVLEVQITGTQYYKRSGTLYIKHHEQDTDYLKSSVTDIEISSNGHRYYLPSDAKAQQLVLKIYNGDNPALKVASVATFQTPLSVVTWLDPNKRYELLAGNDTLIAPNYDLTLFTDSIRHSLPNIGHGGIVVAQRSNNQQLTKGPTSNKWWLWPTIISALCALGYFTYSLLKEVPKKMGG